MKKVLIAIAATMFAATAAHAQSYSGYPYNPQPNGNTYNSTGHGYQGYNSNTGSSWNAQSYGNTTTGTDSHGNSWSYDRSTGEYQNYGTGERRSHGKKEEW